MDITMVGSGYVGLVSGACLSEAGNNIVCVDIDQDKVDGLKRGIIPIYEPGLEGLVQANIAAHRLDFTTSIAHGVRHGEVIFIAVGTPSDEDGSADLQYVKQVAQSIGEEMNEYRVVVTKSTVPVGTADIVKDTINEALVKRGVSVSFSVVSNPEFLQEGRAVKDFMKPDRIVIGSEDVRALDILRSLYAPFNRNHERLIIMDVASAELTKYVANVMLATKVSLMNEMSNLADCLGANIESVRIGIGADQRIGYSFIYPGCGYGGSCLPKDVQSLHRTAKSINYETRILAAVEAVNNDQKRVPVNKIVNHFGADLKNKKFALWGLAFKPDTDDMRNAPSRVVMEALWDMGATVQAFDPLATDEAFRIYGERDDLTLFSGTPYDALTGVDGLIIVTECRVFRASDIDKIKSEMSGNVIVDGRNIFSRVAVTKAGLTYYGIGQ